MDLQATALPALPLDAPWFGQSVGGTPMIYWKSGTHYTLYAVSSGAWVQVDDSAVNPNDNEPTLFFAGSKFFVQRIKNADSKAHTAYSSSVSGTWTELPVDAAWTGHGHIRCLLGGGYFVWTRTDAAGVQIYNSTFTTGYTPSLPGGFSPDTIAYADSKWWACQWTGGVLYSCPNLYTATPTWTAETNPLTGVVSAELAYDDATQNVVLACLDSGGFTYYRRIVGSWQEITTDPAGAEGGQSATFVECPSFRLFKKDGDWPPLVYNATGTGTPSAWLNNAVADVIPSGKELYDIYMPEDSNSSMVVVVGDASTLSNAAAYSVSLIDSTVSIPETADAADPTSVTAGLYEAIRETLLCAAECDESARHNLSMSEAQAAIDSLIGSKLFQDALTEVADGGVSTVVEIALRMVDQVDASDAVLTSWQTAMTVAEVATALDLVSAGWAFSVVETAEANDTIAPFVAMLATLLEEAVATDTLANTLTVTVVSTETAAGADTVTTLAEFFETMDESAVATVTIRLGDDVYTGWVLNTEENAVSEFQRYEFNSFCQLQGEYYAAGTDGIYRIGGSSDAGEAIVGYLKTGLLDFGSSMQKRMDSAWLAIATDGTVRMKVVTTDQGEAEETWYEVVSKDEGAVAENMRLKIGKGLKSRHWQFELVVEDASEFELEELQFIPMILTRRT